MVTLTERDTRSMDRFFQVENWKKGIRENYQRSLFVNRRLSDMTSEQLSVTCQSYGLEPIQVYLDTRTFLTETNGIEIKGFARYFDTYLLQESGGERTKLIQLGQKLTGQRPTARSGRLLRLEITCLYFGCLQARK